MEIKFILSFHWSFSLNFWVVLTYLEISFLWTHLNQDGLHVSTDHFLSMTGIRPLTLRLIFPHKEPMCSPICKTTGRNYENITQCDKMKKLLSPKNISSNHFFSNFFSKTVAFTNFLPKMRESKFLKLPHSVLLHFFDKNFVKAEVLLI